MNALITGGAGFIGSHLAEELLQRGNKVYVIDDLSTGTLDNIGHLQEHQDFTFIQGSILDEFLMNKLIKNCHVIYHLAAAVGVKYVITNPLKSIQINTRGTEIVLDLASRDGKKVILASTSEVYGKNASQVFTENADSVLGSSKTTRWGYACTKLLDEFLALAYYRKNHLPVVIIRFFNICGPRQTGNYGMVIPSFVRQALLHHPITVYGDGKQSRSFTHVRDAVIGILGLANHPEAVGDIFNIGNPNGITIEQLAKKIKELTGSKSEIVYVPYSQAYGEGFEDMRHRVPDVTKAHNLVNYYPKVPLDDILMEVIGYARERLASESIDTK
jgi:UDP-glucose 4-epimerase